MKLRLISDGTPQHTKLVDVETGETLENVLAVHLALTVDNLVIATVRLHSMAVDVQQAEVVVLEDLVAARVEIRKLERELRRAQRREPSFMRPEYE